MSIRCWILVKFSLLCLSNFICCCCNFFSCLIKGCCGFSVICIGIVLLNKLMCFLMLLIGLKWFEIGELNIILLCLFMSDMNVFYVFCINVFIVRFCFWLCRISVCFNGLGISSLYLCICVLVCVLWNSRVGLIFVRVLC